MAEGGGQRADDGGRMAEGEVRIRGRGGVGAKGRVNDGY